MKKSHLVCFLVVVLLLSLIIYVASRGREVGESVDQFKNDHPKRLFMSLVNEFGSPQIIINQQGGFVMWFPSKVIEDCPYESIILKDEEGNSVYTTVIVHLARSPTDKIKELINIHKKIYYDWESEELTVKGKSLIENKRVIVQCLTCLYRQRVQDCRIIMEMSFGEKIDLSSSSFSENLDKEIIKIQGELSESRSSSLPRMT
jgi:hypothetical protein